jgi:uncharacterized repeat protein (TIGR03833 family)
MDYITGGKSNKRYFRIKKNTKHTQKNNKKITDTATVSRISCKDYDDPKKNKTIGRIMPRVGDKVIIIIKPYHDYICKTGIVERVLTNSAIHTRGHKCIIHTGAIGRVLKILSQ